MNEKTKRHMLIVFYIISIHFGFSMIIIDSLIPIITQNMSVGFDKVGIALFIGSITALITNVLVGCMSDRLDIKKLVLLGLFLLFVGFTIFSVYLNFIIFILITIFLRMGFGTIDISLYSFSSKLFKNNLSQTFLKLDIFWYSGAVAGPIVVSLILFFDFPLKYILMIVAFTYLVYIIVFNRICPDEKIKNNKDLQTPGKDDSRKYIILLLKDPVLIIGCLVMFINIGAIMGLATWLTTYFLSLGVRVAYSSFILSAYWIFSIIGMILAKKIITKFKEINILFYSCLLGIACLFIFNLTSVIFIKIISLSFQAIFFATIFPLTNAIESGRSPENSGTILGFTMASAFAGSIVFQPIYGYVAEYLGKEYITIITLLGVIVGFIFISLLFVKVRREQRKG